MEYRLSLTKQLIYQHLLFWLIVLCCYVIANWEFQDGLGEALVIYGSKVVLQAIVAYAFIAWAIPSYLTHNSRWKLIGSSIAILLFLQLLVVSWRYFFLYVQYPDVFEYCLNTYVPLGYWGYLFSPSLIFFKNPANYLPPALVLIAIQHYQSLQKSAEIKEQKRTQELNALKHQLNPHFLFNTLNNLYALAIKKSDKTPEVIGKLAEIMDYILYSCEEKYVPIQKEIELIKNYLALEKIRYGKRVNANFQTQIQQDIYIAPLLLLTFIENAFKHGVRQEIQQANINIELYAKNEQIDFRISNTRPETNTVDRQKSHPIGLKNVRQQLELLYPNAHDLKTIDHGDNFEVHLKLLPL